MKPWCDWLVNLLYPDRCYLCGRVIGWQTGLCPRCRQEAPYVLPPVCAVCGRGEDVCVCRQQKRAFARCVTPFYYDGVGKRGIGQLKNTGNRTCVNGLAAEMAEVIRRYYGGIAFDVIAAVPQYAARERRRGYNPAALLAKALSRRTGVPYAPVLRKLFDTPPQKELPANQRGGNVLGTFDVTRDVAGKTVLLVDDVITTGATLNECAKMLKIHGAAEVYAVTAAGAVLQKTGNAV